MIAKLQILIAWLSIYHLALKKQIESFVLQRNYNTTMLGKIVKVIIDRPLGSYHPNHKDLYYPVNYGFVQGIVAGDGEYQDAYVLGVSEPLTEYTGKVIAIIHRLNDVEDKWVVAPPELTFTMEEIYNQVEFQERYFKIEILM